MHYMFGFSVYDLVNDVTLRMLNQTQSPSELLGSWSWWPNSKVEHVFDQSYTHGYMQHSLLLDQEAEQGKDVRCSIKKEKRSLKQICSQGDVEQLKCNEFWWTHRISNTRWRLTKTGQRLLHYVSTPILASFQQLCLMHIIGPSPLYIITNVLYTLHCHCRFLGQYLITPTLSLCTKHQRQIPCTRKPTLQ